MGKVNNGSGREGFYQDNSSSYNQRFPIPKRNFTWRREPIRRDHTKGFVLAPTASSIVTDPASRDLVARPHNSYRLRSRGLSAHDSVPPVIHPYVHGAYGDPSRRYGAQAYPSHDFGGRYSPTHGSGAYGPPSHGVGAPGPRYHGIRDPGPLSHGVAARSLPSHGFRVHGSPSCGVGAITPSSKFPAVFLRGLPSNCREVDIVQFFDGLHAVDVFISKTSPAEAFVVFSSSAIADYALHRDRQKLGDASVEIFTCRRQDYYDAVSMAVSGVDFGNLQAQAKSSDYLVNHTHYVKTNAVADSELHGHPEAKANSFVGDKQAKQSHHIVKVRCPPYFADKKVIIDVFNECNLSEDRVHSVIHPDGKPTGEVLVEFISQEDAKKAMSKDKTMIGSHCIEILPSTVEDLTATHTEWRHVRDCRYWVKESNSKELTGPEGYSHGKPKRFSDEERKEYTQTVKLRNVPPSADMYDIIEFFGEFNLTLDRLQVVCRRDGIATGEVYVEFDSIEDAKKAMSKDKNKVLSQCVELFPSSPNEASRAMARYG